MTGYVRKDTSNNIADGNIINAADLDAEFDGVVDAFNASTGHKHDGTAGEGAPITVVGPTQDVAISATAVTPKTTNTVDLGSSSLKFKDIFIAGTATLPTVNATTVDTTNIEVTNIKAKDGTASATIADSTGVMTIASAILTTADINGGTIDGATIATSNITVGASKTLDVSAGTLMLANDQISGDKVEGGTIAATTITTLTSTTGNITTVNATTVDTTNVEVTNIKAKDGTASATIADSTGVMTIASSILTTADINGGTIDGTVIGGTAAAAGAFTTLSASGGVTLAGGTANGVAYLNGSKVLTTGSALTFDGSTFKAVRASSGSVANFTRTGGQTAVVYADTTGVAFGLDDGAGAIGSNYVYFNNSSNYAQFNLAGSEQMRLTSTGLGIGTSSPSVKLQSNVVRTSGQNVTALVLSDTVTGAQTSGFGTQIQGWSNDGAAKSAIGFEAYGGTNNDTGLGFYTQVSAGGLTRQMTISHVGNVGIGTSSPGSKLDVYGAIRSTLAADTNYRAELTNSGGATQLLAVGTGATMQFWVQGSERARITSGGSLLVGTTSDNGRLSVAATGDAGYFESNSAALTLRLQNASANNTILRMNRGSNFWDLQHNNADNSFSFDYNDTERARIDSSGNLLVGQTSVYAACDGKISVTKNSASTAAPTIAVVNANASAVFVAFSDSASVFGSITRSGSSTAYNTSSDYRLKENIQPMTGALAKVQALKPCTYKWKADGSDGEGFIAHELAEVVPQCVTGEKDAVDKEGNPVYQGIDTSFLVATLTAAIQELKAEFDAYKASHP